MRLDTLAELADVSHQLIMLCLMLTLSMREGDAVFSMLTRREQCFVFAVPRLTTSSLLYRNIG